MSIPIIRKLLKVTHKGVAKEKYIARVYLQNTVSLEDLAELVNESSTLSKGDFIAAITECAYQVGILLGEGHPVDLGDLGRLYPAIDAKSCDTAKEVGPKSIKDIGILFRVNKELKNRIRRQGTRLHTEEVFSTYRNKSEMKILEE